MSNLPNLGLDLGFTHGPIRRLIFCLTTDDSGSSNVISISDAATLANWQTQFDQYAFLDDASDKFVPSPLVREVVKEQVDAIFWEVEDYKVKMRNGQADINFAVLDPAPYIIGNFAEFESETISVFFLTENSEVIGIKDGTDLKPIPIKIGSFSAPFYGPRGYEEGSRNTFTFRLNAGTDLNNLVAITISDSDVFDDSDFYSLRDASATISSPATTGCVFTPTVDDVDPSAPGTTINISGITYDEIIFRDQADQSTISLAASGSLSYSSGEYTVNEASLLTSGHTYDIEISHSGYDIVFTNSCVVP